MQVLALVGCSAVMPEKLLYLQVGAVLGDDL